MSDIDEMIERGKQTYRLFLTFGESGRYNTLSQVLDSVTIEEARAACVFKRAWTRLHSEMMRLDELDRLKLWRDNARVGFVYLMHLRNNVYKIGRSYSPNARVKAIENDSKQYAEWINDPDIAVSPKIIHIIPTIDMVEAERMLHSKFRDFYGSEPYTSESFVLTPEQIEKIKQIEFIVPDWFRQMTLYLETEQ